MTLFGALILASLNADTAEDTDDWVGRYTVCRLDGSLSVNSTCPTLNSDQENQLLQIFNISVAVIVINILLLVWSVATHWGYGMTPHFRLQPLLSLVNLGLFAGLVGWFNFSEDISEDSNIDYNVYLQDYNPYFVAIAGLVAGIVDTVVFTSLNWFYFKKPCQAGRPQGQMPQI